MKAIWLTPSHSVSSVGQMVVEYFGHTASLAGSFFISIFPIILFGIAMPETLGNRGQQFLHHEEARTGFVPLA